MKDYTVGNRVMIDSIENLGGPATIIEIRNDPYSKYKIRMDDNNQPPFWAWNWEISNMEVNDPGLATKHASWIGTQDHIKEVQGILGLAISNLYERSQVHDQSKLESPEIEVFDEYTDKLKASTYGSDEYKSYLAAMKPALDHHYAANSHHPEHWPNGICDMSLLDILEMLCDWLAATKRHANGDIRKSIEINQKRFGYSDELKQILINTLPVISKT